MLGLEASVVHHGLVTGTLLHDERWRLHINSKGWLRAHREIASLRTILGDRMTELRGQLRQLEEHLRCASDLDLQLTILTDKCGKAKVLRDLHEDLRELIQRSHSLLARRCMSWESEARANEAPNPDEMWRRAVEPPDEVRKNADEETPGESSGYRCPEGE